MREITRRLRILDVDACLVRAMRETGSQSFRLGELSGYTYEGAERSVLGALEDAGVIEYDFIEEFGGVVDDASSISVDVHRVEVDPLGLSGELYYVDATVTVPESAVYIERVDHGRF